MSKDDPHKDDADVLKVIQVSDQSLVQDEVGSPNRQELMNKSKKSRIATRNMKHTMNIEMARQLHEKYQTQTHHEVIKGERKRLDRLSTFSPREILQSLARSELLSENFLAAEFRFSSKKK